MNPRAWECFSVWWKFTNGNGKCIGHDLQHQLHGKASSLHCTMGVLSIDSICSKPRQNERQHHVKGAWVLFPARLSSCWPFKTQGTQLLWSLFSSLKVHCLLQCYPLSEWGESKWYFLSPSYSRNSLNIYYKRNTGRGRDISGSRLAGEGSGPQRNLKNHPSDWPLAHTTEKKWSLKQPVNSWVLSGRHSMHKWNTFYFEKAELRPEQIPVFFQIELAVWVSQNQIWMCLVL